MSRRSTAAAVAARPPGDRSPKASARPPVGAKDPSQLRPEDLTPIERKLGDPGATRAELGAAYKALFARARATPGGCFAVVPEGLEGDDGDP